MQDPEQGTKRAVSIALLAVTVLAVPLAAVMNDVMVFVLSGVAAYMLLLPSLKARRTSWEYPNVYNLLLVSLAYFLLFSGGLFTQFGLGSLWSAASQLVAGAMVGGVGFLIAYGMLGGEIEAGRLTAAPVAVFAFCIGMALGALWEIAEFALDLAMGWGLQSDLADSMADLAAAAVGAGAISITALSYMRNPRPSLFHLLVRKVSASSPGLVVRRDEAEALKATVARGEGERMEFKASLRTNIRTGEADKRMEHAVLKTIAAFLNSDGGVLFVGINDDGSVRGVDAQCFDNLDKFYLHFANLLGEGLGKETLPYIDSRLVPVDGVSVLEVRCMKASSPVFLKNGSKEEFYVRSGASSIELLGREMLEYVGNHFRR